MEKRNIRAKLCIVLILLCSISIGGCSKSKETSLDLVKEYIKEKNYPKAIRELRDITEYKNAEALKKEVRDIIEAPYLSCNYTYVAAINKSRGVNAILGDYGFVTNTTEWQDILYLDKDESSEMNFCAVANDGRIFTVAEDCMPNDIRLKLKLGSNSNIEKMITDSYFNGNIGLKTDGTVVYQCENLSKQEQDVMNQWTEVVDIETGLQVYALTADGKVLPSDLKSPIASELSSWSDIIAISASLDTVVGLKQDGTVVVASENQYGSNNVSSWSDIVAIDTCGYFTIGLKSDGTLVTTEYQNDGLEIAKAAELSNLYVPSIAID
ncbi:hypothetical protein lbkm_2458 [Lachnospiraceae bacterium KM106-2]|nr:hypothetical protein lbkm_2458 [Lachnospiraceae bacterium KM106-2]